MLTRDDFYVALRLIALAQQGLPLTTQSLKAYSDLPQNDPNREKVLDASFL